MRLQPTALSAALFSIACLPATADEITPIEPVPVFLPSLGSALFLANGEEMANQELAVKTLTTPEGQARLFSGVFWGLTFDDSNFNGEVTVASDIDPFITFSIKIKNLSDDPVNINFFTGSPIEPIAGDTTIRGKSTIELIDNNGDGASLTTFSDIWSGFAETDSFGATNNLVGVNGSILAPGVYDYDTGPIDGPSTDDADIFGNEFTKLYLSADFTLSPKDSVNIDAFFAMVDHRETVPETLYADRIIEVPEPATAALAALAAPLVLRRRRA